MDEIKRSYFRRHYKNGYNLKDSNSHVIVRGVWNDNMLNSARDPASFEPFDFARFLELSFATICT